MPSVVAPPDSLDITGYISNYYGTSEFYPLSAVAVATPEPSSVVLLGLGAIALAGAARRHECAQRLK